jgi:hypothetical protein
VDGFAIPSCKFEGEVGCGSMREHAGSLTRVFVCVGVCVYVDVNRTYGINQLAREHARTHERSS